MREIPFMVRSKHFTAIQQVVSLKSAYKFNNSHWILRHHGFTWYFDVTPTPISDTYKLKIVYNETFYPSVYVVSPKPLALAKGATKLPHTYDSKKQHLCLFSPHCGEWNSTMLIANTIVHWAIEWLYYYENWAYTGKWLGGGHGNWDADYTIKDNQHSD